MEGEVTRLDGTAGGCQTEARSSRDCSLRPVGAAGDGVSSLNTLSTSSMDNEAGGLCNKEDAAAATEAGDEASFQEETTVEVCVKMVVCRKVITRTLDAKTGKVISTTTRMEEDPPTIMDVHSYTTNTATTTTTTQYSTARFHQGSAPIPAPAVKRRPGRPRKHPPTLTSPPHIKSDVAETPVDSTEDSAAPPEKETEAGADQPPNEKETGRDASASQAVNSGEKSTEKTIAKSERRFAVATHRQIPHSRSPSKPQKKRSLAPAPLKRRRGRPSRVIKRPKKYQDSFDEESPKHEQDSDSQEEAEDEESEEEEEEEVVGDEEEGRKEGEGNQATEERVEEQEQSAEGTEESIDPSADQRTECPKCCKQFSTSSNCQRHITKDKCSREHQCGFCDKIFSSRMLFKRHVESHRDELDPENYRCNDCNRCYATRNGYLKHKRQGTCYKRDVFHEDGTQGEFECKVCHVRFTTEKLLNLHNEKVHENPNNEFKCPDCGRVFYSKQGFNKHTAKKSCTQPHVCKVCGKRYSNKAKESYKSHMRYHLAETSGVQYQCEDCGRVYMTDMALKKHRLTSHSGVRPYKCATCSKTFPMRYMVRDHERSHTGEKPFLCSLCGTSFSNRGHLYRHMRSHQLGTLHKRGRPRKYPQGKPLVLTFPKEEAEGEGEGEGVMEIKADPVQQEELAASMMDPGSTYITVHTIDGQLSEQAIMGEGPLQHVVMETPDGMTENMVLQVIRDLTGATTVYQQVAEPPSSTVYQDEPSTTAASALHSGVAAMPQPQIIVSAPALDSQQPQIIVSTPAMDSQQIVTEPVLSHTDSQQIVTEPVLSHTGSPQIVTEAVLSHADSQQIVTEPVLSHTDSQQIVPEAVLSHTDSQQLMATQPALQTGTVPQPRIIVTSPH